MSSPPHTPRNPPFTSHANPHPQRPTSRPTRTYLAACSGVSNATLGKILPPVMSAWRISSVTSVSMARGHGGFLMLLGEMKPPRPACPSKADRQAWRDTRRDDGSALDGGGGLPRDGVERGLRVRLVHRRVDGRGAVLVVVVVVLLAAGVGGFTGCRDERKAAYLGWMTSSTWSPFFFMPDERRGAGDRLSRADNRINYVRSSLNWGPTTFLNVVSKTYGAWPWRRGRLDDGYVLEWDEWFMRMYVDSRLHHMMELRFNKLFWERGDFPNVVQNGTESIILENPWVNGTKAAPFDQLVWFSLLGLSFLDNYYDYHVHIHPPIHPSTPDHYPLPL
ncbi:hypothetical protein C8J57DRAFT_1476875 [Mycena rebaudengoi]|nr:hypothetical protein C8J57DRAFT_1476875 [Mycena rebaudengoi]